MYDEEKVTGYYWLSTNVSTSKENVYAIPYNSTKIVEVKCTSNIVGLRPVIKLKITK